jgi:hypothetical protein
MNPQIFLLLPLLFVGGIFSTISGGGLGIIIVVFNSFFLDDIRTNIAFASLFTITTQLAKIYHFHSYIQWKTVGWYVATGVPMSFVGGLLLFLVPERLPEICIGLACLGFVIMKGFKITPHMEGTRRNLLVSGFVNGFIGGLIGNAALVRNPALLSLGLRKEVFVGTSAATAFLMNIGKVSAYVPNTEWTNDAFLVLVLSVPVLLVSVSIGKRLLRYVSEELFEKLLLVIITIGALRLLFL